MGSPVFGVANDLAVVRLRRVAIDPDRAQSGGVQRGGVIVVEHHHVLAAELVKLPTSRVAAFFEPRRVHLGHEDELVGRGRSCESFDMRLNLGEAAHDGNLKVPLGEARVDRMHVGFDQPGDHRPAMQVDLLGLGPSGAADLLRGADGQNASFSDRYRFGDRPLGPHGDDLAVVVHDLGAAIGNHPFSLRVLREKRHAADKKDHQSHARSVDHTNHQRQNTSQSNRAVTVRERSGTNPDATRGPLG